MKVLEQVNSHINSINPYQPGRPIEEVAREMGIDPNSILKLASNESALGVALSALKVIQEMASESHIYPDGGGYALKNGLAKHFDLELDNFILGAGSNEILVFLSQCLMGEGKSVVASEKAFVIYKILAKMTGSDFLEVPMKEQLTHDLDAILAAIRPDTTLVFVCNPNNPTGSMVGEKEIADFMAKVPDHVLVVFDEAYAEICLGEMPDTVKYVREGRSAIVLRTFSKAYGLAGLRVGYGIAAPQIIQALEKPRQPFNTTILSQSAALAALDDEQFLKDSVAVYAEGKAYFQEELEALGFDYIEPFGNFILIKFPNAVELNDKLTQAGVIVRPMVPYGLADYIRVTFGTMEQNRRFFEVLKELL